MECRIPVSPSSWPADEKQKNMPALSITALQACWHRWGGERETEKNAERRECVCMCVCAEREGNITKRQTLDEVIR